MLRIGQLNAPAAGGGRMEADEMARQAREANGKLEAFLARYQGPANQFAREGAPLVDMLTDLGQLAGGIEQAGLTIAGLDGRRAKFKGEREAADRYACHLQRLRKFLQDLVPLLEARREHLSHVAVHFRRAMDWSKALSMTSEVRTRKE